MRQFLEITVSSFKMALQELWKNKLRTFLSLFGVTIGIFCIISVLATVQSLEKNIQASIKSLGSNTIYIDKWEWTGGGPDYPYWKFAKRPNPKFEEVEEIRRRTSTANHAAFVLQAMSSVEVGDNTLSNVRLYGVTPEYPDIQPIDILYGRLMTESEYEQGAHSVVIGYEIAEQLFGMPERAVGREIQVNGRRNLVAGVIKKQGSQIVGGWQFDKSVVFPYKYIRTIVEERYASPIIMVQGKETVGSKVLKDELTGAMRSVRRLNPTQENNFALNDINDISESMEQAFTSVNIGGWAIGALAFIVGIFGVANIMFVTVKERTPQIGLKKAIGAKRVVILSEFLLESAFLCIIGGLVGLLLVFGLTVVVSNLLDFPIFLSPSIIVTALFICIVAGVAAGIIPASQAAKMDPVAAIRSK